MNKSDTPRNPIGTLQGTTATPSRVFTSLHKRIPVITKERWEKLDVAARIPRKGRRYPEITEALDTSIQVVRTATQACQ